MSRQRRYWQHRLTLVWLLLMLSGVAFALRPAPAGVQPDPGRTPAAPPVAHIDARLSRPQARVGEQVLLTIEVRAPTPPLGHFHPPRIGSARLFLLGETRRTLADTSAAPVILERRYALFPTEPGPLEIPPLRFDAWGPDGSGPAALASSPLTLSVAAPPPAAAEQTWLPAHALTLTEAGPSQVRLAPGQAISRLLTLRAEGLPAADLPPLPLALPPGLEVSADAPRLWNETGPAGIVGHRSERLLIIAPAAGDYRAEPVALTWWRIATGTWETATLPAWELTVAPLAVAARRQTPDWRPDQVAIATGPTPDPTPSASTPAAPATAPAEAAAAPGGPHWPGALLVGVGLAGLTLLGLILLGLRALWVRRRRPGSRVSAATNHPA
ncbi:MAG: hypothetical protein EA400_15545 [Chromatiaceae bacterium]|nr:MAG: hypothetical protein EA400_15545 [Chromatiaceae bacterium]